MVLGVLEVHRGLSSSCAWAVAVSAAVIQSVGLGNVFLFLLSRAEFFVHLFIFFPFPLLLHIPFFYISVICS